MEVLKAKMKSENKNIIKNENSHRFSSDLEKEKKAIAGNLALIPGSRYWFFEGMRVGWLEFGRAWGYDRTKLVIIVQFLYRKVILCVYVCVKKYIYVYICLTYMVCMNMMRQVNCEARVL